MLPGQRRLSEKGTRPNSKNSRKRSASASGNADGNDKPPWRSGKARAQETESPQISIDQTQSAIGWHAVPVPPDWLALGGLQSGVEATNVLAHSGPRNDDAKVPPRQAPA